jgi:multicomponent Na+:H+ antiporter subunit F
MTPESLVLMATIVASLILSAAFLLTVYRVIIGPTLPDRVIALDMLVGIATGFIAVIAIRTGFDLYVDIALSLCLVGFLATVAFARFILSRKVESGSRGGTVLDGTDIPPATDRSGPVKRRKKTSRRQRK